MIEQPLVSVLMTTYNREKYIGEAIDSVLNSTYKNFELIVVDDGSKDSTVAIARKYQETDPRVKVFVNEENLGDYPNRNKAASHATGKYLKYVDADDYIYPTGLQVLVAMMEKHPDAGYGLCSLIQVVERPYPFLLSPKDAYLHHYTNVGLFHKAPLSAIIRRDVFEEAGGFGNIRMAGDFEMWHRLSQKYNVLLMPDGVVWYREHDAQEVNSYKDFILVYEQIKYDYLLHENCPLDKTTVEGILNKYKKSLYMPLLKSVLLFQFDKASIYLKRIFYNHTS